MDEIPGSNSSSLHKMEDVSEDAKGEKPKMMGKTLNRVPRACNACRKQKMKCDGADNPPCRRCRHAGLECLFEKPSREATLTGEAGLERIRSLESHVAEIRHSQGSIQAQLAEILSVMRGQSYPMRSPSAFHNNSYHHPSPSVQSMSPSMSTSPAGTAQHLKSEMLPLPASSYGPSHGHGPLPSINTRNNRPQGDYRGPPVHNSDTQSPHGATYPYPSAPVPHGYPTHEVPPPPGPSLPPFSSIQTQSMGPPTHHGHTSSVRFHDGIHSRRPATGSAQKRHVTSADSSDIEEDETELPASGLVAPWEVLRGLADVAIERAAKENGDNLSEPQSRTRTPSPGRQVRPSKRRKLRHKTLTFPDVVTKNIITEQEARELFKIFYHGCSTFLPVFDVNTDTFEALHERSPFAVDCICMVAAQVRDGGGKPSDIYLRCLEEVQAISCATLFSPVTRAEAVQAMILVSGWSDNGWLSGGHAVRMAMELSMHKAWPALLRRMKACKASDSPEDRELIIASRTWLCLYLFEHQLSYGTGRPAILKDDESICHSRAMLQHPLAIEDDMRLVSTVELMAIRERVNNKLSPFDQPVNDNTFHILRESDAEFRTWYATWDQAFSQKYENAAFYRQSLQIQQIHAELFHNATALRGIDGPEDVQNMHPLQRELAVKSIHIAVRGLDITVNSPAYREGMKYAVHYTHATATFAASFLLRLARLFPEECNMNDIRDQIQTLAQLMSEIPGKRYALTLQLMLKRAKNKHKTPNAAELIRGDSHRSISSVVDSLHMGGPSNPQHAPHHSQPFPPPFDPHVGQPHHPGHHHYGPATIPQQALHTSDADRIWHGFETTAQEQLPVWLSDQSLGGNTFSQQGMDAFLLPTDYMPAAPQIW